VKTDADVPNTGIPKVDLDGKTAVFGKDVKGSPPPTPLPGLPPVLAQES